MSTPQKIRPLTEMWLAPALRDDLCRRLGLSLGSDNATIYARLSGETARGRTAAFDGMSDLRRAVARKLNLGEQATSEEIYQAAIEHIERMRAEGERRADKDARRIGGEIDEAVGRFPSSRSAALGASHAHVIGLALAREARRLVACGDAPNLAEAQRMAVRADPSILRR